MPGANDVHDVMKSEKQSGSDTVTDTNGRVGGIVDVNKTAGI